MAAVHYWFLLTGCASYYFNIYVCQTEQGITECNCQHNWGACLSKTSHVQPAEKKEYSCLCPPVHDRVHLISMWGLCLFKLICRSCKVQAEGWKDMVFPAVLGGSFFFGGGGSILGFFFVDSSKFIVLPFHTVIPEGGWVAQVGVDTVPFLVCRIWTCGILLVQVCHLVDYVQKQRVCVLFLFLLGLFVKVQMCDILRCYWVPLLWVCFILSF